MVCSGLPRRAGDRSPSGAQIDVITDMPPTCMPMPTDTDSSVERYGLRNTPPCANLALLGCWPRLENAFALSRSHGWTTKIRQIESGEHLSWGAPT